MSTPRTVVFDLGRVLIGWEPYRAVADRMSPEQWQDFWRAVDFPTLNGAMDAGLSLAEARARLAREHPEHVATLVRYVENFAATLTGPVPGTAAVVAELRAAGVALLGLTNWSAETFHHAEPVAPAIGLLDAVVVSGQEGLAKPDPALFRLLLARFDLDPGATVFVDDAPANVAGAEAVGIRGLLFTGADRLRADLAALGLPVATPGPPAAPPAGPPGAPPAGRPGAGPRRPSGPPLLD